LIILECSSLEDHTVCNMLTSNYGPFSQSDDSFQQLLDQPHQVHLLS